MPKFGIRTDQGTKCEAPVESTRVGKHPGRCLGESFRVQAPADICSAEHGRQGAFSEKGDHARCASPHLRFELGASLPEFRGQDLIGTFGRSIDHSRYAAAIFEQAELVFRLQPYIGETCEMQDRPEAIVGIREVTAVGGGSGCRINAAENYVQATGENVRMICDQSDPLPHSRIRQLSCSVDRITPER